MNESELQNLAKILLEERKQKNIDVRNEKIKKVMLLLGSGALLATTIIAPGTAKIFRYLLPKDSEWQEWKQFNISYLRRTLRKLEQQKLITVSEKKGKGLVILTENGRKKLLEMSVDELFIRKPERWDGKWRMVFYDVNDFQKSKRDKFRKLLLAGGFYPWQKSVYLHAYPCEKEIDFLRCFLGVSGEVRIVIAEKIENDQQYRDYFGV